MKKREWILLIVFLLIICGSLISSEINSTNYKIVTPTISNGGDNISSSNYIANAMVGIISGITDSTSYKNIVGFYLGGDSTAPTITINTPLNTSYKSIIVFNVTATDISGVDTCIYSLDGSTNKSMTNLTSSQWNATNSSMIEGSHIVIFYCNDTEGIIGNQNVTFTVDITPPSVIINTPLNITYANTTIVFNVTATDLNGVNTCVYSLDNTANKSMTNITANEWNATNSSMTQVTHNVKFYCNDTAGNINGSKNVTFLVDTSIPQIEFVTPTPNNLDLFNENYTYVNVSTSDANNHSAFIDWNRSLVGWWRMDAYNSTGIYDNSTYNNFGTFNGGLSTSNITTGIRGQALKFDGSNDYINITNNENLNLSNEITVSAWVKNLGDNGASAYRYIVSKDNSNVGFGRSWFLGIIEGVPNKFYFRLYNSAGTDVAISNYSVDNDTWYYVVGTYNNSKMTLYVNGQVSSSASQTGGIFRSNSSVQISGGYLPTSNIWNGSIDDVMIFNRALSAQEIKALYNAGTNRLYNNFTNLTDGNYTFKAYAYDEAGNMNFTETRTITVDTTPPNVTINTPQNTTYPTLTIIFNVTATDSSGISACVYSLDNTANKTMVNLTANEWNATNSSMTQGIHTVKFYCNDTAGNINGSLNVTFTIDVTNPIINVISPTNSTYNTSTIWFNASADETISTWIVNYNGTNVTLANINTSLTVEDGTHHLFLYGNDSGGNWGLNDSIWFTVDTTFPDVNSLSATPANQGFGLNVTLNADVSENNLDTVLIGITPPGESETNYTMENTLGDSYQYNYTDYTNGTYIYKIYANDTVNHINGSESGNFNMFINLTNQIRTLKDNYSADEVVNLTDPPELKINPENLNANLNEEQIIITNSEVTLNQPVLWKKTVKVSNSSINQNIEIPSEATNIELYQITDKDKSKINAKVVSKDKEGNKISWFKGLLNLFSGKISGQEIKEVVIEPLQESYDYEINYQTPGPIAIENKIKQGKRIIITSKTHYQDILAYTTLDKEVFENQIKLYRTTNGSKELVNIKVYDKNNNGYIDYIEWTVPHLSEQTYELIIEIKKAEYLNSDREFILDISQKVKELDNVWSPIINNNEFVRVTFESVLNSSRDITIYPKIISGNPRIEVYEINSNELIAEFSSINSNEYNKIYLTNLVGEQDTFDLKIIDGSVKFDHIIDPSIIEYIINGDFYTDSSSWAFTPSTADNTGAWVNTGRTGGSVYADTYGRNKVGTGTWNQTFNVNSTVINGLSYANLTFCYNVTVWNVVDTLTLSVTLTDPSLTESTVWSYSPSSTLAWTCVSVNVTSNFTSAGNYNIKFIHNGNLGNDAAAQVRNYWDDISLNLTDISEPNPPTYSNILKNDSAIYQYDSVQFNTTWVDENLNKYIFSINDSGSWQNTSAQSFPSNNVSTNVSRIITNMGKTVGWRYYANDTWGNSNSTSIQEFQVGGINWSQEYLFLGSDLVGSIISNNENILAYLDHTGVSVSCISGACTNITSNFTSGSINAGTKEIQFSCTSQVNGTYSATFSLSSTEYPYAQNIIVNCTMANTIQYNNFEGNGQTSDLSDVGLNDAPHELTLDDGVYGQIAWHNNVTLNATYDMDSTIVMGYNSIYVNSAIYPNLNASANVTMRNLNLGYPTILKDGIECSDCEILSWNTDTDELIFNVSSFSEYTAEEANQSKAQNNGTTNTSIYLLLQVQKWSGSEWDNNWTIYNATVPIQINTSTLIKYDQYFNGKWNTTLNGTGAGTYRAVARIVDDQSNTLVNTDGTQLFVTYNFSIIVANEVPNTPTPNLVSVDGTNKTLSNLNCSAVISDPDADTLDVSVRWYKNGGLNQTIDYNNSYANGTTFSAILDDGNTTKLENWTCQVRLYDGALYSDWGVSNQLTILNTLPTVTLVSPNDYNTTTNRTPEFIWSASDDDNDALTYDLNLTCYNTLGGGCAQYDRYTSGISTTNYVITQYLEALSDNDYYYNWSVKASDDSGVTYGDYALPKRRIDINAELIITLINDTVSFGTLQFQGTANTTTNNPWPFLLQNDGNCMLNISTNATDLWNSIVNPNNYYQFKVDNQTGENGSFNSQLSNISWSQMPANTEMIIVQLNWSDTNDTAEVDILVEVPIDEGSGDRSSNVVFTAELGE